MIDIPTLFAQIAVMALMILPGTLIAKAKLAPEGLGKGLSNIVLYVTQPVMIVAGFLSTNPTGDILIRMLAVFVFSVIVHVAFFFVAKLFFGRAPNGKREVLIFATTFSNAGFFGIPLLVALFGQAHPEIAIYASIYVATFNIYVWSLGAYIFTHDKSYISPKKMFLNPSVIATYIGLFFFALAAIPSVRDAFIIPFFRVETSVLYDVIQFLQGTVAPLAMFIVGLQLAKVNFRQAFREKTLYLYLIVALFVIPLVTFSLTTLTSILGIYDDPLAESVLLLSAATPAATATSMFAELHEGDTRFSGLVVSVSSLLCIITMPIVSLLTII